MVVKTKYKNLSALLALLPCINLLLQTTTSIASKAFFIT